MPVTWLTPRLSGAIYVDLKYSAYQLFILPFMFTAHHHGWWSREGWHPTILRQDFRLGCNWAGRPIRTSEDVDADRKGPVRVQGLSVSPKRPPPVANVCTPRGSIANGYDIIRAGREGTPCHVGQTDVVQLHGGFEGKGSLDMLQRSGNMAYVVIFY
jgi:hypothetical protein